MSTRKVAPAALWQTGQKGIRSSTLTLAFDAAAGVYYVTDSEPAAAWLVPDGDVYRVDDVRGANRAQLKKVGPAPARVIA